MSEQVVLLHGIWMRGFTLALMARRLRAAGFEVSTLNYSSVTGSPEQGVARVLDYIDALPEGPVHLVGHSLGGLLALRVAERLPDRCRRMVCLGTPLNGSAVARVLARWTPLRWTLGEAREWLCDGLSHWPQALEVAMIAGRLPIGFGMFLSDLEQPHDGTVAVSETQSPRLAAHAVVGTTHSGLLLSEQVASMTTAFLRHGRFQSLTEPASASVAGSG